MANNFDETYAWAVDRLAKGNTKSYAFWYLLFAICGIIILLFIVSYFVSKVFYRQSLPLRSERNIDPNPDDQEDEGEGMEGDEVEEENAQEQYEDAGNEQDDEQQYDDQNRNQDGDQNEENEENQEIQDGDEQRDLREREDRAQEYDGDEAEGDERSKEGDDEGDGNDGEKEGYVVDHECSGVGCPECKREGTTSNHYRKVSAY